MVHTVLAYFGVGVRQARVLVDSSLVLVPTPRDRVVRLGFLALCSSGGRDSRFAVSRERDQDRPGFDQFIVP